MTNQNKNTNAHTNHVTNAITPMPTLIVGSGAREHAIAHALKKSALCAPLYAAPGNPGIAELAICLPINVMDIAGMIQACRAHDIRFVVIGPENPIGIGMADALRAEGIACFAPSQAASQLETSKAFLKNLTKEFNIPTATFRVFDDAQAAHAYVDKVGCPIVIKADGLAAGKGVALAKKIAEAHQAIDDAMTRRIFGDSGDHIVIEEFMSGEEVSFFVICDGTTAVPFAAAQDHKAAYDGDTGPNTGGMGAYSPVPSFTPALQQETMDKIIRPTLSAMKKRGTPFIGVLFAGLMLTDNGVKLIEYNIRFGDPEAEVILPRFAGDLGELLYAAATGSLAALPPLQWHDQRHGLCVVYAAQGYPASPRKGTVIRALEDAAEVENAQVLHAGTARNAHNELVANGGRVLTIVGYGDSLSEAKDNAYKSIERIKWPEGFYRKDIGWRALQNSGRDE